jgi:hypothetical protein
MAELFKSGADQRRRHMKNLVLAGALLAILASPAFAEDPYSKNDPYEGNAKHLNAQDQQGQMAPQAQPARPSQSTVGMGRSNTENTNNGPNGTVIRDGQVVGQDPDPKVRALIGSEGELRGRER